MTEETNVSEKTLGKFSHTVKHDAWQIIADYQLNKIDILKIDIEGAEKEVFEDTSSWIGKVECVDHRTA